MSRVPTPGTVSSPAARSLPGPYRGTEAAASLNHAVSPLPHRVQAPSGALLPRRGAKPLRGTSAAGSLHAPSLAVFAWQDAKQWLYPKRMRRRPTTARGTGPEQLTASAALGPLLTGTARPLPPSSRANPKPAHAHPAASPRTYPRCSRRKRTPPPVWARGLVRACARNRQRSAGAGFAAGRQYGVRKAGGSLMEGWAGVSRYVDAVGPPSSVLGRMP